MFENFGLSISRIFKNAELIRYDLRHPYVGSEHLLLAILKENDEIVSLLKKYNITYSNFKKELVNIVNSNTNTIEVNLYTPLLKRIIENSLLDAKEDNNGNVTIKHLLISMLEEGEGIALRVLLIMDVDIEKLYDDLKNKFKKNENISIDYGNVLNDIVNMQEKVMCRENEIQRIIETLLRHKKNNPLLIGKAGVGKTAIVEELARRINNQDIPFELKNYKIITIEMGSLVSGTKYRGEFEEKLTKIIDKVISNQNVILFIDEIHSMVNAGAADGAISAADILKPYLARGDIKVIGATTIEEYNKYFLKDKALCRRFETIEIKEPSLEQTKTILNSIKKVYEKYHNITINKKNIDDIVELSNKYIFDKCNPDKSIELLDTVCAKVKLKDNEKNNQSSKLVEIINQKNIYVKNNDFEKALRFKELENNIKNKICTSSDLNEIKITKYDILDVIERKTLIPLTKSSVNKINDTIKELNKNVIGQENALSQIKKILFKNNETVKSMFFVGPTGVGKTMTAKLISKNYNLIKLDMEEYTNENSISKLIGSLYNYDENYIFKSIKNNPHSLILINNIDKANYKVLNIFYKILDEGKITDIHNEEINFSNCLVIATSNFKIDNSLGFENYSNKLEKHFGKELLSKFDKIIEFNQLKKEDVVKYILKNYNIDKKLIEDMLNNIDYSKYSIREIINKIDEVKSEKIFQVN